MIYMDYAAHTPALEEIRERFMDCDRRFIVNPNSANPLAEDARICMEEAEITVAKCLNVDKSTIIFTSSATESNNLAVKGLAKHYRSKGRRIITSMLDHASMHGPIKALESEGYEVEYVDVTEDGVIDQEHLVELLEDGNVFLVALTHVDSELGIRQPIAELGKLVKEHSKAFFHVDGTQALGKIKVDLDEIASVDSYTFSAHKFHGMIGCGGLFLRTGILIEPLHHGGLSQSAFRSGTPTLALIDATAAALEIMTNQLQTSYEHVQELNKSIIEVLSTYPGVVMNSTEYSIPHVINISFKDKDSEAFKNALANQGICVSTKSACCAVKSPSQAVLALTKNQKRALRTLRISLSHQTTQEEVNLFIAAFDEIYKNNK